MSVSNGGIVQERVVGVRPLHDPQAGLVHLEEPFGSLKAWCGADVLGVAGFRMGSVTCPECVRLEEAEKRGT